MVMTPSMGHRHVSDISRNLSMLHYPGRNPIAGPKEDKARGSASVLERAVALRMIAQTIPNPPSRNSQAFFRACRSCNGSIYRVLTFRAHGSESLSWNSLASSSVMDFVMKNSSEYGFAFGTRYLSPKSFFNEKASSSSELSLEFVLSSTQYFHQLTSARVIFQMSYSRDSMILACRILQN